MYCTKCGANNPDGARFCGNCGHDLNPAAAPSPVPPGAGAGAPRPPGSNKVGALGILFFCIPLVGAILYFVWKDEQPEKAKKACWISLAGLAVGVVLQVAVNLIQLACKGG